MGRRSFVKTNRREAEVRAGILGGILLEMFPAPVNDIMKPSPHSNIIEPEIENVEKSISVAKSRMLSKKPHSQQSDDLNDFSTNRVFTASSNSCGYFPIWIGRVILVGAQGLYNQGSGNRHKDDSSLCL